MTLGLCSYLQDVLPSSLQYMLEGQCGAPPEYHCSQTVTAHTSPGNHSSVRFYNKYHEHMHIYKWIYKSYMVSYKDDGRGKYYLRQHGLRAAPIQRDLTGLLF